MVVKGGWMMKTDHLVFHDPVFLVDLGALCAMASGHEVVELFLGEAFGAVVRAGEAEDAFWLCHVGVSCTQGGLLFGADHCLVGVGVRLGWYGRECRIGYEKNACDLDK